MKKKENVYDEEIHPAQRKEENIPQPLLRAGEPFKGFQLKAHPSQKRRRKRKKGENDRKTDQPKTIVKMQTISLLLRDFFRRTNAEK